MKISRFPFKFGPATLVTAAFIGPGTVVTASLAGAHFGYSLLWALLFAVVATMILQEMAARVGVVTQSGLGEALRAVVQNPGLRIAFVGLVVAAVVVGNSAYQGGNLTGAGLGAESLFGDVRWVMSLREGTGLNPWAFILGTIAAFVLWRGEYRKIEAVLIGLVVFMSCAFIATFLLTKPDIFAMVRGLFVPSIPAGGALTMLALVGTTVVPYALFLHAAGARLRWPAEKIKTDIALREARADIVTSIPLGGLVSIAIVSTAAAAYFGQAASIEGAADLAVSLEPLFGSAATYLMAAGLLAAGLSSAITAPLASAYALVGVFGGRMDMQSLGFRLTWLSIIAVGVVVASLGIRPISLILFAQVANGILLPLIAGFLLIAVNQASLATYRNNRWQNMLGGLVFLVALLLGLRSIMLAIVS